MNNRIIFITSVVAFSACFHLSSVDAQLIPDDSLGSENSTVTTEEMRDFIEGGAIRDNHLFHSFLEFDVNQEQQVYFANPEAITNIFTRVTGNNLSNILGTLGVNGAANLFLINPNGIAFGADVQLDIAGSFTVTTANSLIVDNYEFSATNPESVAPLLTINITPGLQYGMNNPTREITNAGSLTVGENLTFVGGTVTNLGSITLANGEIDIVADSLFNEGTIATETFNNTESGDINIDATQDVVISNRGQIKTTTFGAGNAGNINLNTQRLSIRDINQNSPSLFGINSLTSVNSTGNTGNITINAVESVEITGNNPLPAIITLESIDNLIINSFPTSISTIAFGAGNAGNIDFDTGRVVVKNGAAITTNPVIFGEGGNININAKDLFLQGFASIAAVTQGFGNSGEVVITSDRIELVNGATIISQSLPLSLQLIEDVINLNIEEFNLENLDQFTLNSLMSIGGSGTGSANRVTITTNDLIISNGSNIGSTTITNGKGGTITISAANSISVIGRLFDYNQVSLITTEAFLPEGNTNATGGDIVINTDQLILVDGGAITANTFNQGKGGNVNVNVTNLDIIAGGQIRTNTVTNADAGNINLVVSESINLTDTDSGLFANTASGATGNSGSITVETNAINISDRAAVAVNSNTGNSGTINLSANTLNLDNKAVINAETESGGQGNITLNLGESLTVANDSLITASTTDGEGGDLAIQVNLDDDNFVLIENNSGLLSEALGDGTAGNLTVQTNQFTLRGNSQVAVSGLGVGGAGNLNIIADLIELSESSFLAETAAGNEGNINLDAEIISLRNNSDITTNASGEATGGNININTGIFIALEDSDVTANAYQGQAGRITITTEGIFLSRDSNISATSVFGVDGTVEVHGINDPAQGLTKLLVEARDAANQMIDSCPSNQEARFIVIGRGGIPADPRQSFNTPMVIQDMRSHSSVITHHSSVINSQSVALSPQITEATGWIVNERGNVELVNANQRVNTIALNTNC